MIDKENQMISISLKEYEELLELKWIFSHSTNKPDEIYSSILNIISKRIKLDTYDNSIVERNYNDAEKILKEITELFKYVNPELYERLVIIAKDNLKIDKLKKIKEKIKNNGLFYIRHSFLSYGYYSILSKTIFIC